MSVPIDLRARRHLRRVRAHRWRQRQVWAAVLLAAGSTAATLGWIAVTLASYAWWGSPSSPLAVLFWPGMIAFGVWGACRLGHWRLVHRPRRPAPRASVQPPSSSEPST